MEIYENRGVLRFLTILKTGFKIEFTVLGEIPPCFLPSGKACIPFDPRVKDSINDT